MSTPLTATRSLPVARPVLGDEEAAAVQSVLASGWVAQGPRVAEFERQFAAMIGVPHAVAVTSATAALHLMVALENIGPGDEVIVPSLSFIATANCVRYVGATPVFADVDPATANVTPETVEPVLTARTTALIAVHQGGVPADVRALRALCEPRGIAVLEDAACAAGSESYGLPTGTGARSAAWSFHPRKLITTGEGGMLTVDNPDLARRATGLRQHGMSISAFDRHASGSVALETYDEVGFNYRMTDLQAAVGLVQLTRLPEIVARRRAVAAYYRTLLADVTELVPVAEPGYGRSNVQSFWVQLRPDVPADRDAILATLAEHGVGARRGIMAAHLEPAYRNEPLRVPLPSTEAHTRRALILPVLHDMTENEQEFVIETLTSAIRAAR